MNRHAQIRASLTALHDQGFIYDWYMQSGMPGRRWIIWTKGWQRSYTTAEVEAFIQGAKAVIFHQEFAS